MERNVIIILQARMASTRLPGKVLMHVMGRPLLGYQIERLRFSDMINEIIVATTVNQEDDPIIAFCQKEGLGFYRGSEDDVLDRYYRTAKEYDAKHIMRVTADCPFVEPKICDSLVKKYFETGLDYIKTGLSFAEGVGCEVFSFASLERAWREAKLQSEREHVTLYIRNNPTKFRCMNLENESDDSKYRITVDEKEDFMVVKSILENVSSAGNIEYLDIEAIKRFLDLNPEIGKINSHIIRNEGLLKSLREDRHI